MLKLYELIELISRDTVINVIHEVTGKCIPETSYNDGWIVESIRAVKRNIIEVKVI